MWVRKRWQLQRKQARKDSQDAFRQPLSGGDEPETRCTPDHLRPLYNDHENCEDPWNSIHRLYNAKFRLNFLWLQGFKCCVKTGSQPNAIRIPSYSYSPFYTTSSNIPRVVIFELSCGLPVLCLGSHVVHIGLLIHPKSLGPSGPQALCEVKWDSLSIFCQWKI